MSGLSAGERQMMHEIAKRTGIDGVIQYVEVIIAAREAAAKAESWDEGYAAFGQQFVTPLRDDGTRESASNPYRAAQVAPSRVPGGET